MGPTIGPESVWDMPTSITSIRMAPPSQLPCRVPAMVTMGSVEALSCAWVC